MSYKYFKLFIMPISLLDINYIDEILKLTDIEEKFLSNFLLDPDEKRYQLYGEFSSKLNLVIGLVDSQEIPAWSLIRPQQELEKFIGMINHIISIKEKDGLFQFFTLNTDAEYTNLHNAFGNRYQSYLEHTVNNSLTGYENIDRDILQYKIYKQSLKIYFWILKNEYRII